MAQKRDNGTGTIYKRSNGTWAGKIYLGKDSDGKEKFKYFSGKTEPEVKRKIKEYIKSNTPEYVNETPLEEYLTKWLRTYKFGTIKESSYDALEKTARNQIIPYLGSIQMQAITSDDIQDHLTVLRKKGYSHSVVKKTYDCLNMVLTHAAAKGDISKNPMSLVNMPGKELFETKEIRFFDKKECALITEEAVRQYKTGRPVYVYGDAYILMLNTGIRMGEAIGLEKEDWDKEKKTLHIKRNIQSVSKRDDDGIRTKGKKLVTNSTKTYSGNRVLPLNKNATEALQRLCDAHPNSKNIICDTNHNMIPPERLERTFYYLLKNIGIDKCGLHSLRHTFASMLFAAGKDIKTISTLLGHASTQITINTYVHLFNKIDHDAVAELDGI